jgi:NADPH-dependent 2,4-dienoyl-CoA reductase/sulfur reductase-like enzyme
LIAKTLDEKVDLIHVSAGSHEDPRVFTVTHPSMFLKDGVNVKYAAEIKKHVTHAKIATVGALADPAQLEEIIASGKADVVELARGLISDPDLPHKARTGREDERIGCMRCFVCFSGLMTKGHIVCALNPETGNEAEMKFAQPVREKKTVLVAGGGVAGVQAALTASERGHQVILCEKTDRLGGVLLCEEKVPFKKHLHEYLERQARMLSRSNVSIRLNTEVTPALAESLNPDVLIAALGARPAPLPILQTGGPEMLFAQEVYREPEKAGKLVVILGGGLAGSELAVFLGDLGHEVTLLEQLPRLNAGGNILQGQSIGIELQRLGVRLAFQTKALERNADGVIGERVGVRTHYLADTVICAAGVTPLREEANALRFCAPAFYQIGDCLSPKNIAEATRTAYFTAINIGRC